MPPKSAKCLVASSAAPSAAAPVISAAPARFSRASAAALKTAPSSSASITVLPSKTKRKVSPSSPPPPAKAPKSTSQELVAASVASTVPQSDTSVFPPLAVTSAVPDRLIRVVTLNVAGLRAALKKGLAEYCLVHRVDVLCLQEVKCDQSKAEELSSLLSIFRFHYWSSGSKPGYAGVATLSNIEAQAVSVGMGCHGHDDVAVGEGRMLTLHFAGLKLCNVYVPNSEQHAAGQHLLVVGDMNVAHMPIDLANPKTNVKNAGFTPEERDKFSMLLQKGGLTDVFRQRHEGEGGHYSFWSFMGGARARNVGWRLDYALASPGLISSIEHLCYDHTFAASDHCPMLVDLSKSLFPTSDATPSDGTKLKSKTPKQKGISSFFKMAK